MLSGEIPLSNASCKIYDERGNVIASVTNEKDVCQK